MYNKRVRPVATLIPSQVSTKSLLPLKSLEETLEITSPEPIEVVALDHLDEDSGAVTYMLGEDLKEIPVLVKVHEDVEFLKQVDVLVEFRAHLRQALAHHRVVRCWDTEKGDTTLLEAVDRLDDVDGAEGDVLNTRAVVEIDESVVGQYMLFNHCSGSRLRRTLRSAISSCRGQARSLAS